MLEQQPETASSPPPFRLDVQAHDLLMKSKPKSLMPPPPAAEPQVVLPVPAFPEHPELFREDDSDIIEMERKARNGRRPWSGPLVARALRGWAVPCFMSRILPEDFHPIIAYLFTE